MQGALRDLIPFSSLSDKHFTDASAKLAVTTVNAGEYLFSAGDSDNRSIYLLDGEISFLDISGQVTGVVTAGTGPARYPLANQQPRLVSARATIKSVIVSIDSTLLDVMLTIDQSVEPRAAIISTNTGEDWMIRILQSEAFIKIPPANIQRLLNRLESVPVRSGDVIIKQGNEGDYFYIIREGACSVTRQAHNEGRDVPLAELSSGDCFGEEALVSDARRNATVTMLTDGSLMRLSKQDFLELLKKPLVHYVDYKQASTMVSEGDVWLDVRLADEYANYALGDSINIPLSDVRDQATELPSNRKYIICCDTGRRSAAAAFLLSQRGFEVCVLDGGLRKDVPVTELGMSEESRLSIADSGPSGAGTDIPDETEAQIYSWDAEVASKQETDIADTDTLQATLAKLTNEMANYMQKSAQLEAAVSEAREARATLQERLDALAALINK